MNKKLSIEEIESSVNIADEARTTKSGKTAVSFKKKSKKRKIRRVVILSLAVIVLGVLGYFGWIAYQSMKNIFANENAPGLLGLLDKKQLKGESSGRVNILVLGVGDEGHDGATLSDTIMVVSYDVSSKNISMISIPRDLYVKIDVYGYSKINSAHAYGEKYKYSGGGPQLARDTISYVLDIPIHYYVRADFTGFSKLIDAVGGVDIDVEKNLYDPLYPGGTFNITKGLHHMDGKLALKYARSRETTSDFDRAKRQQQVMIAFKDKLLSTQTLANPKKIAEIIQITGNNVKTDFQTNEIQRLIEIGRTIDSKKIVSKVLDNAPDGLLIAGNYPQAGYTLIPKLGLGNYSAIRSMAKNIFNDNSILDEAAKLAVYNGTSTTGLAANVTEELRASDYIVQYTGSDQSQSHLTTIIYDNTNGVKPKTILALEKIFKVKSQKNPAPNSNYDIEIIVGKDYK